METSFESYLLKAMNYTTYRQLVEQLLKQGKVTGSEQSNDLVKYTELNIHRMNRVEKTGVISEELKNTLQHIKEKQQWLVISEGWCGDAAQIVPFFSVIAAQSPNIQLKIVLRDENPELIDRFLTNGGRAIPKLLILNEKGDRLMAHWGPRPAEAQKIITQLKNEQVDMETIKEKLHLWYAKNKNIALQQELIETLKGID